MSILRSVEKGYHVLKQNHANDPSVDGSLKAVSDLIIISSNITIIIKASIFDEEKSKGDFIRRYKYLIIYLDVGKTSIVQVLIHGTF